MRLNLPDFDIRLRQTADGHRQVYDSLRGKFVALTPEELVRQHFVNYLVAHLGYPAQLIANEVGIRLNNTLKRCDTVVYDRSAHPLAIVEYKAPSVAVTERVFDQIVRYNMTLSVNWLIVSNGINHYCCRVDRATGKYTFLRSIPSYDQMLTAKSDK